MNTLLTGALAGIVGTFAMTRAKLALFPMLPSQDRYPLPPREITEDVGERLSPDRDGPTRETTSLTTLNHFAFGAGCGALFTALGLHRRHPLLKGTLFGLGIWATSYLGWLPMLRVLTPATRHPAPRNALMIAVHVVWGVGTGYAAGTLQESDRLYGGRGPLRDRRR